MATAQRPKVKRANWVRSSTSENLHAILGAFARARQVADLTERQEKLWDVVVKELERRKRSRAYPNCSCWMCSPPQEERLPF